MISQQEAGKALASCAHTPFGPNIWICQQQTKTTSYDLPTRGRNGSNLMRSHSFWTQHSDPPTTHKDNII
ncbi:hypothetical protein DPMN_063633 [Dreissena polymorpha]|uniref:Uncharacterized protein n=1 Tax=Dreissena polymorpha TaxID=45954 RepID=A0A9D4CBQ5_DREPO|nr:hypothetical protein DPMN_063633 [Dreissena polymorpha]